MANDQIQYVTAPKVEDNRKKYCRFKKNGIKYKCFLRTLWIFRFASQWYSNSGNRNYVLPRREFVLIAFTGSGHGCWLRKLHNICEIE